MSTRIEKLRAIAAKAPKDPFPHYGIAMELKNAGQKEEARAAFEEMEQKFPDYIPQYLMHAQLLVESGDGPRAAELLRRGIPIAQKVGNGHAAGEMQQLLQTLE
jgi:predicted Zn-dependent protease